LPADWSDFLVFSFFSNACGKDRHPLFDENVWGTGSFLRLRRAIAQID